MSNFQFKNKTILIISPEKWGENYLSKHHYAIELSKENEVYFLNSQTNNTLNKKVITEKIAKNITVIHYKKTVKGLLKLPSAFIDLQFKSIIKEILNTINQPIDILWDFDQYRFPNSKAFKAKRTIFHPVDIMKQIPAKIRSRKSNLSDLTLYLSNEIIKDLKTCKPCHFINHGISEDFFRGTNSTYPFISKEKINVGYVGNIQSKFLDWKTLKTIVKNNPTVNFIFIGPYQNSNLGGDNLFKDIDFIKLQYNCTLLGSKPANELTEILPSFDAFLICYDTDNYRKEVSNSHKLLEYCSSGKVIISNYISTYANKQGVLEMVDNNIDLPLKFKNVISNLDFYNTSKKSEYRINFAKKNTYKNHIEKIAQLINSLND